jgi:hypothetical protein
MSNWPYPINRIEETPTAQSASPVFPTCEIVAAGITFYKTNIQSKGVPSKFDLAHRRCRVAGMPPAMVVFAVYANTNKEQQPNGTPKHHNESRRHPDT